MTQSNSAAFTSKVIFELDEQVDAATTYEIKLSPKNLFCSKSREYSSEFSEEDSSYSTLHSDYCSFEISDLSEAVRRCAELTKTLEQLVCDFDSLQENQIINLFDSLVELADKGCMGNSTKSSGSQFEQKSNSYEKFDQERSGSILLDEGEFTFETFTLIDSYTLGVNEFDKFELSGEKIADIARQVDLKSTKEIFVRFLDGSAWSAIQHIITNE